MIAGIAFLLTLPAPYLNWGGVQLPGGGQAVLQDVSQQAHIFGIAPINVFNAHDLRMAENWFTISAIESTGDETLLPVFTEDGRRLDWHLSDRIYFGGTLPWA